MITVNLSEGKTIHSQRNNELNPGGSCGATSAANAIVSAEIPFEYPEDKQLEDYITAKLMTKEAMDYMKKAVPGADCNPWNTIETRTWAINELAGKPIVEIQSLTLEEIIFNLVKKNPVVMGGSFTKSRHVVCTVGFETDQENILSIKSAKEVDLKKLKNMILDDSWGNYNTGYKSHEGNDTRLDIATYRKVAMDGEKKKRCQVFYYKGKKG